MKRKFNRSLIVFAVVLGLAAPSLLFALTPSPTPLGTPATSPTPSPSASASPTLGAESRRRHLDEQLDSIFADTFRGFGDWFSDSKLASSLDLREQKDKYVVHMYLPDADTSTVHAQVENQKLHITAAEEQKHKGSAQSERYEQIVSLPGPVASDKMQIQRKRDLVVITLPKSAAGMAAAAPAPRTNPAPALDLTELDQSLIDRMTRMQGRMEQIFRNAFPNDLTSSWNSLRLGSAVKVDEQKDKYVVRFYLPEKNLQDVDVKLDGDQLRLSASETEAKQQKGMSRMQTGRYEQVLTLPGPVREKGMQVARQQGTITVTLPKA